MIIKSSECSKNVVLNIEKSMKKNIKKSLNKFKKNTCKVSSNLVYLESCDMIAKKREVAAG